MCAYNTIPRSMFTHTYIYMTSIREYARGRQVAEDKHLRLENALSGSYTSLWQVVAELCRLFVRWRRDMSTHDLSPALSTRQMSRAPPSREPKPMPFDSRLTLSRCLDVDAEGCQFGPTLPLRIHAIHRGQQKLASRLLGLRHRKLLGAFRSFSA